MAKQRRHFDGPRRLPSSSSTSSTRSPFRTCATNTTSSPTRSKTGSKSSSRTATPPSTTDATKLPSNRVLVIVHRTEDISNNLGGESRKALQQALGDIDEDPAQLESLLKLTEKVIFDTDDDIVRPTSIVGTQAGEKQPTGVHSESLAIDAVGWKDFVGGEAWRVATLCFYSKH